jgi:DNA polymerase
MDSIDPALLAQWKRVRLETDRLFGVDFARLPLYPSKTVLEADPEVPAPESPLENFRKDWATCSRCSLSRTRTNLVFGEGNPEAELMFVGEAPGAEEDRQGKPFVGKAGQLLTRIIEAMGFARSDVYIANILKCRPPGNRDPSPDEVAACLQALKRQIEIIDPKVIVTLGRHALVALAAAPPGQGITKVRGRIREFEGRPLMPTFHPAYLLRNPGEKRKVWEDMKQVMQILGSPVPPVRSGLKST